MKGSHSLPRLGHHPEHEHPLDAAELGDENPTGTMKAMLGFVTLIPTYVLESPEDWTEEKIRSKAVSLDSDKGPEGDFSD